MLTNPTPSPEEMADALEKVLAERVVTREAAWRELRVGNSLHFLTALSHGIPLAMMKFLPDDRVRLHPDSGLLFAQPSLKDQDHD